MVRETRSGGTATDAVRMAHRHPTGIWCLGGLTFSMVRGGGCEGIHTEALVTRG